MKTKHKGELLHEKKSFIFHYHGRYAYHHPVSGMWEYRQQRKSKKAAPQGAVPPRYGAASSALRQKYGDRPPPLFSRHPFSSLFQSSERPAFTLLIHRTILIFVPQGKIQKRGADMDQNVNYYGIILLLRQLRESGSFSEKELRRVAARIAADSGVDIMISL